MDPCSVCGGTDVNLVDGYYYCVECGTQDVNVRETIVEQTVMGDGTFAHTTSRRITTVVKDGIEMSSEWYKWHTFNFILAGLTDELIALGAKPTVKMKVLWIWSRYVKHFKVKDDSELENKLDIENDEDITTKEKDNNESVREDSHNDDSDNEFREKFKKAKLDKIVRDIKTITKGTLLCILYVALNLDRSDIQLSHLFRFVREGRLSLYECMKFVPKELKVKAVKNWKSFILSQREYNPLSIRELGMTCFKLLKLGVPLVPDLRKLVANLIQELCLPDDVKDLVFSLMYFTPVDFLDINSKIQKSLVRIPDYEGICMSYILVALKMCFGLDDDYELKISNEVDKINDEENFLKAYKLGMFSEESCDRLFSFKQWCQHLHFRKYVLCKNYLPMSRQFKSQTNDYVFMEHLEKRKIREIKLSDDVTMDILNKIKSDLEIQVIPKDDFPVTLTPMTTYIDVLAHHVQNPELRLLLCEDFSQYSLKYAIKDLSLPRTRDKDNSLVGVCESGKTFNNQVMGTLTVQEGDMTMVYVRNCQNKNWLKTEPTKVQHVTKIGDNENSSDKESDHGYDSNVENSYQGSDVTEFTISDESINKVDKNFENIPDLDVDKCVFDDDFIDVPTADNNHAINKENQQDLDFEMNTQSNFNIEDSTINLLDNVENYEERESSPFPIDPKNFDRDEIIKQLTELACITYKIPTPKEDTVKKQRKRKVSLVHDKASSSEPKKKRTLQQSKAGEAKREIDTMVSVYYNCLQNDSLNKFSQQVKSIIENLASEYILDNPNILDTQKKLGESDTLINKSDDLEFGDIEKSHTEMDINDSLIEKNQTVINSDQQSQDNISVEENIEDNILEELFPKSDPKFDEKVHDIRQLYVTLEENSNITNNFFRDIDNDPEIDKIIKNNIVEFSNNDKSALEKNKVVMEEIYSDSDSDVDDLVDILKDASSFEKEKMRRKEEQLEPLIRDLSHVSSFTYWIRHYKSSYVVKSRDIGKKFDLEINENLPLSFVFVIRECAAILGCSMFSLYKNMQNIEEILIAYR